MIAGVRHGDPFGAAKPPALTDSAGVRSHARWLRGELSLCLT